MGKKVTIVEQSEYASLVYKRATHSSYESSVFLYVEKVRIELKSYIHP